jgi:Tfp pilus assembly protein PilN
MSQQINLCSPILTSKKRYFSAQAMLNALALYLVLGGGLAGAWVWQHDQVNADLQRTTTEQDNEIKQLKGAADSIVAAARPIDPLLEQTLQRKRQQLSAQQQQIAALRKGLLQPGWGHSDRLQLVARTIPAQVWIRSLKVDNNRFSLVGYTIEPAALNDWVNALSANPLMAGLKLADVRVEKTNPPPLGAKTNSYTGISDNNTAFALAANTGNAAGNNGANTAANTAPAAQPTRATWDFELVSIASAQTNAQTSAPAKAVP